MDPITHGIVGAAISSFSGTAPSLSNPLTLGAILGSVAPDIDIIIKYIKNDAIYMDKHRGTTHAIPFLLGMSVVIATGLSALNLNGYSFIQVFLWTFLGALSHTALDILNSYGAKLFQRKIRANILTLYDPILILLSLYFIMTSNNSYLDYALGSSAFLSYLLVRWRIRKLNEKQLHKALSTEFENIELYMMPSLKAFYKWDFVAHTESHDIVGKFNPWKIKSGKIKIIKVLDKDYIGLENLFLSSKAGKLFSNFSPNLHFKVVSEPESEHIVMKAIDLRYYFKDEFLHNATAVFNKNHELISVHLHPYNLSNSVLI